MRYALGCIFFIFGVYNQPVGVVFGWFASALWRVAGRGVILLVFSFLFLKGRFACYGYFCFWF